jgi:UDP-N-acetylmuramate dehydrogenase
VVFELFLFVPTLATSGRSYLVVAHLFLAFSSLTRYDPLCSRRRTQPVTAKTAGCVFRNPGGDICSAGALVEQLGLKGFSIGGAQVSAKHANFLVNTGFATCEDMRSLINEVKKRVKEGAQVDLQEEIRYVAYSGDC